MKTIHHFVGDFSKSLIPADNIWILTESNKIMQYPTMITMQQQSVVYDLMDLQSVYLTSCKNMPTRIYNQNHECVGSIVDRKQNSEKYLSAISMAKMNNEKVYGAGMKFLSEYDVERCKATRLKNLDKFEFSTVAISNNMIFAGDFQGNLHLLNNNDHNRCKAHVDGISCIFPSQQYILTCARFDDYRYLWDVRKMDTFVTYYRYENKTYQRMNGIITTDKVILGQYDGNLTTFDKNTGQLQSILKTSDSCVNCVIEHQQKIYVSTGQRNFEQKQHGILMSVC